MRERKKTLIKLVFEQAKKELSQSSTSSVAAYLSLLFEEKYGQSKNERSFVRYYKSLVEDNEDYNIDSVTLDQLSAYINYKSFSDFSENYKNEPVYQKYGSVKIAISDEEYDTDQSSKIVVNITNSPVFSIPEFFSQHKNSLGIVGILIIGSLWLKQSPDINKIKEEIQLPKTLVTIPATTQDPITNPVETTYSPILNPEKPLAKNIISEKKKECMSWNEDHYEAVFCNENYNESTIKVLDEDRLNNFKKINQTDTLTVYNALGKVWYDKSDKQLEFFTNHGLHPTNGKTLKPVTAYIIKKYTMQN